MKKFLIAFLMMLVSLSAVAEPACSRDEVLKMSAIAAGVGLAAGATMGFIVAATMPVGAVGGPAAITYFPGTPVMAAWMTKSVIPMTLGVGIPVGAIFGWVVYSGQSEACAKYIEGQVQLRQSKLRQLVRF